MKVVILCGGKGSRIRGCDNDLPKPLLPVRGKPIIFHIMSLYSSYGFKDFILPLGYKGDKIKEYFINYKWKELDFIQTFSDEKIKYIGKNIDWNITFIDTGIETMTGGRISKIKKYLNGEDFLLTYGDGLSDVNINELISYHREKGKIATLTGIKVQNNYGMLNVNDGVATSFSEKPKLEGIVNGGFFVLDNNVFDFIEDNDECIFEQQPLKKLAKEEELAVYSHKGKWLAIDTFKDLEYANTFWDLN